MKKLLAVLSLLSAFYLGRATAPSSTSASVNLAAPATTSGTAAAGASASYYSATQVCFDGQARSITVIAPYGTATVAGGFTTSFVPNSTIAPIVLTSRGITPSATQSMSGANWSEQTSGLGGAISAGSQTTLQGDLIALLNHANTFIKNNVLTGTQNNWQ